jgi:FKBP-type peptidyl-prolyl cis-trans isomerase FkpA
MFKLVAAILVCLTTSAFAAETVRTNSGLEYTSLREGTGATPGPTDTVVVNYRGTLLNGREFDSSYRSGRPVEFQLGRVIKCWTEGLQLMKVGGKAELSCPSNLAYGQEGIVGSIPPNAPLIFEVELLSIK